MNLKEKAMKGMDLSGLLIIDSHMHMDVNNENEQSAKELVGLMDEVGISKCLNSSLVSLFSDFKLGNDMVYRAMKEFPGRFLGLCVINPNYTEEIVPEIEKRMAQGFVGIKIHPYSHNTFADDDRYHVLYEYADKHKLLIKSHTYKDGNAGNYLNHPLLFGNMAKKYKNIKFVLAHSGGSPWGFEESIKMARKYDNIYLELCSTLMFTSHWLKKVIDGIGSDDKIFYGSDGIFYDPRPALGEVIYAKIPDKSKEKILGLNVNRLITGKN